MKQIFVLLTVGFVLLSAACSQSSEFVVVNDSMQPVKIVYKIRSAPPANGYSPKISDVARLNSGNWQSLAPNQYLIDLRAHTITLTLPAQTALRIVGVNGYAANDNAAAFPIQEITFYGANSEIVLSDNEARQAFVNEKNNYYLRYK